MNRIQMFDTPHKALRLAFSQLLTLAGKTDFQNARDVACLQRMMREVFSMVYSHSHHEDDICFAALDARMPNATHHDRAEHVRLHTRLDELEAQVAHLLTHSSDARQGRTLYGELCQLHAEMLQHFLEEERDTQPLFWAHMSDAEISAFEPQILAAMTPEMSRLWLRYILPSATHPERVGMLTGMREHAPEGVFEDTMTLARQVLNEAEFSALETTLAPTFAPLSI